VDGQGHTPWVSAGPTGPAWMEIDLQAIYRVQRVDVQWHSESSQRPRQYKVGLSAMTDGTQWESWGTVYTDTPADQPARAGTSRCHHVPASSAGPGAHVCSTTFSGVEGRWIRIDASAATTGKTIFALWEVTACVEQAPPAPPLPPPSPPHPPPPPSPAECADARGRPTKSNSEHSGAMLVDGDAASPWISDSTHSFSNKGKVQQATVDLEANKWMYSVVVLWHEEAAWRPADYSLQIRPDHSHDWSPVASVHMETALGRRESALSTHCSLVRLQLPSTEAQAMRCETTLTPAPLGRFLRLQLDRPDNSSFGRPYMAWELHVCASQHQPPPSPQRAPRWVVRYRVEMTVSVVDKQGDYSASVLDAVAATVARQASFDRKAVTAELSPARTNIMVLIDVGTEEAATALLKNLQAAFDSAATAGSILRLALRDRPLFRISSYNAEWSWGAPAPPPFPAVAAAQLRTAGGSSAVSFMFVVVAALVGLTLLLAAQRRKREQLARRQDVGELALAGSSASKRNRLIALDSSRSEFEEAHGEGPACPSAVRSTSSRTRIRPTNPRAFAQMTDEPDEGGDGPGVELRMGSL